MAVAISIPTKIDCFASLAMTRFLHSILISDLPLKKGTGGVELGNRIIQCVYERFKRAIHSEVS